MSRRSAHAGYLGLILCAVPAVLPGRADNGAVTAAASAAQSGEQVRRDVSQVWTNELGMEFVPVPGTDVLFCRWETRVKDFEAFVKETGHNATNGMLSLRQGEWKPQGDTWMAPGFTQDGTHPVVGVNWDDARAFCKWLTAKDLQAGRLKAGREYRLPQDWEWSVAVGLEEDRSRSPKEKDAAIENVYPWGREWPPPNDVGNYADHEAKDADWPEKWLPIESFRDGFARTAPVGSFTANKFGIHDLGGNVWEWCEESYDEAGAARILRGGAWVSFGSKRLLSSYRTSNGSGYRYASCGFRVVVSGNVLGTSR